MSIIHIYSNKILISLPTQPPTHTHIPHRYHTGIHTTHWQKTRKTNLAKWIKTHLSRSTSCLEQQDRRLRWRWRERETRSTVYIDTSGGDGENEKQDRRFTLTPLVAMARTRNKIDTSKGKRWRWRWQETFNPIQPETQ